MAPHLQYFLITVKLVALDGVSFSDSIDCLNGGNLLQPIQMQLCQKQKNFCVFFFFFAFLKSILNFKHLTKKDDPGS